MFRRLFTKEEAETLLPELRRVLAQMRQAKRDLEGALARLPEARGLERRALEEEIRFLQGSLEMDARHLAALGVFLKDLDRGLVDFPARLGGEVVFLCWQEGEEEVGHYHPLNGGFADRRPLNPGPTLPAARREAASGPPGPGHPDRLRTRGDA